MYLEILGRTECGLIRSVNEDGILLARKGHPPEFGDRFHFTVELGDSPVLVAVADGMGGKVAGEVTRREVLSFLAEHSEDIVKGGDVPTQLINIIEGANRHVRELWNEPEFRGGMTTLTAACFQGGKVHFFQVGDSRAYVFREEILQRMGTVQNLVEMLRKGGIPFDQASSSKGAYRPLQAIGGSPTINVELTETGIETGDLYLLCTDGITFYDKDGDADGWIPDVLRSSRDLGEIEQKLFEHAEEDGFLDNASSILVRVTAADAARA